MVFANIEYLFLLLLLVPYIVWYIMKRKKTCLLYTSQSPRDPKTYRMPSSA